MLRAGVEVKLEQEMGKDFTLDGLLSDGYSAAVLAIGAHECRTLGIAGEELDGVYPGVDFLRDVALGNAPDLTGKRVGVIGGGNVAIDAVRTAWRLGASEAVLIYRRQREQMPAYAEEVKEALHEGVRFELLTNPTRILGEGSVSGVECLRYELGAFDRSGRRRPMPIQGSEFTIPLDVVIPAIGQEPDLACLEADVDACTACGMDIQRNSTMVVDRSLSTTREGIFAAGDVVLGPASVIEAVAQGNKVARSVARYLSTGAVEPEVLIPGYEAVEQVYDLEEYANAKRPEEVWLPVEQRTNSFDEVELCIPGDAIREECKRCLRCDLEWLQVRELPEDPQPDRVAAH